MSPPIDPSEDDSNCTLKQLLEWLYGTQLFGVKLGLEGVRRLAKALAIHAGGPEAPCFIHVAGTNGKGSTCAMIDAMCRAAGLHSGLYTSPHLISLQERVRLNGRYIPETELLSALKDIRERIAHWEPHPTFFEIVTVLALQWFQKMKAQVVVLETGMGGRLDATNLFTPRVSVLTPVGLDHQQYLGTTLTEIAREKAGIFKPGTPVVSAPQPAEVREVFERRAQELGCALTFVDTPWDKGAVNLPGTIQRWNAALAVAAIETSGLPVDASAQAAGLAQVSWPGRFQRLSEDVILDGAHNPPAAEALAATWQEEFPNEQATLVFGALQDKDVGAVLRALKGIVKEVILVPLMNPRAHTTGALRMLVEENLPSAKYRLAPNIAAALALPVEGRRLVAGSLYLVGEILAINRGSRVEISSQ